MKSVKLSFESENGDAEIIETVFDAAEIELLQRFVMFIERIRETTLFRRGMPFITNIDINKDGLKFTYPTYENGELHELLHVLRHGAQTFRNQFGAAVQRHDGFRRQAAQVAPQQFIV